MHGEPICLDYPLPFFTPMSASYTCGAQDVPRRHPSQIPEPPQLAPFSVEE